MSSPIGDDERSDFCYQLQTQLKSPNFWVTDFLAHRLMDVELTFCCGESENSATVAKCAEYCEELLRLECPTAQSLEDCLLHSTMHAAGKAEVEDLLRLSLSPDLHAATTRQACSAVSAFFGLVYTRKLD